MCKRRTLIVSGTINNIAETLGSLSLQIEGHDIAETVMCSFEESQKAALMKLKVGEKVAITGIGDGKTSGLYVGLVDCKVR